MPAFILALLAGPAAAPRLPVLLLLILVGLGLCAWSPWLGLPVIALALVAAGALAARPGFRATLLAEQRLATAAWEQSRAGLISSLPPDTQARVRALERKVAAAVAAQEKSGLDAMILDENRQQFDDLGWIHLKVLLARRHLLSSPPPEGEARLKTQLAAHDAALARTDLGADERSSHQAARDLIARRLDTAHGHARSLAAIEADLDRIEQAVGLAQDQAGTTGRDGVLSDLRAKLGRGAILIEQGFGAQSADVAAIERARAPTAPAQSMQAGDGK